MRRLTLPRRPCQTVIWGGRPDLDRWVGSAHDLRMAAFDRYFLELRRRNAAQAARIVANLTVSTAAAARAMRQTQAAIEAASPKLSELFASHREAVRVLGEAERRRQERLRASLQRVGATALRHGLLAPDDRQDDER